MKETAQITTVRNDQMSSSMSRAHNFDFRLITNTWALEQKADSYVFLFNISQQEHLVSRPPLMKEYKVVPCPAGQPYVLVATLPQPMNMPKANVDSGELDFIPYDARKFAMDICNPDNTSLDQNAVIDPLSITNENNNLGRKGIFWVASKRHYGDGTTVEEAVLEVVSSPEFKKAMEDAKKRLENYYKEILSKARAVEVSQPAALGLFIGPDHHAAADYFGEEHSAWHARKAQMDFCPICGERIKINAKGEMAAYHKTEFDTLCINNWDIAVKAGVRTRAQAYEATGEERFAPRVPGGNSPKVPTEE